VPRNLSFSVFAQAIVPSGPHAALSPQNRACSLKKKKNKNKISAKRMQSSFSMKKKKKKTYQLRQMLYCRLRIGS
jgi:hypothetical protein